MIKSLAGYITHDLKFNEKESNDPNEFILHKN